MPSKGTWSDRIYLPAILKGMATTIRHIFRKHDFTAQYPERPKPIPPGYRGVQRLNRDTAGRIKCTSCLLCETNCPADAIHIEASESPWDDRDKVPAVFDLDLLRCVFCGYCEEACPVDAIELTEELPPVHRTREAFVLDMKHLLANYDKTHPDAPRVDHTAPDFDVRRTVPHKA